MDRWRAQRAISMEPAVQRSWLCCVRYGLPFAEKRGSREVDMDRRDRRREMCVAVDRRKCGQIRCRYQSYRPFWLFRWRELGNHGRVHEGPSKVSADMPQ